LNILGTVLPLAVIVSALLLLSMIVVDWHVNKLVFAIAVNGVVLGVNVVVYNAIPLTILAFDMYPGKNNPAVVLR
jgi:hypothetical protein